MRVRPIMESEIPVIASLEVENFSDPWSKQGISESLAQPGTMVLVAEDNHILYGYIILYSVLDEGEIARIAVSASARRRGVGALLLTETKRICLEKGIARLFLEVRSSNLPARSLYEKFGFTEDGTRKRFYQNPEEDAVLMSICLS